MTEREYLIKQLKERYSHTGDWLIDFKGVVSFILADRKRIVEPLVKEKKTWTNLGWPDEKLVEAIEKTIRNSEI